MSGKAPCRAPCRPLQCSAREARVFLCQPGRARPDAKTGDLAAINTSYSWDIWSQHPQSRGRRDARGEPRSRGTSKSQSPPLQYAGRQAQPSCPRGRPNATLLVRDATYSHECRSPREGGSRRAGLLPCPAVTPQSRRSTGCIAVYASSGSRLSSETQGAVTNGTVESRSGYKLLCCHRW